MAAVTIKSKIPPGVNWDEAFRANLGSINEKKAGLFCYETTVDGVAYEIELTSKKADFSYSRDHRFDDGKTSVPKSGTIEKITIKANGNLAVVIKDLSFNIGRFFRLAFDQDDPGSKGDGWRTASQLLSGNDTFAVGPKVQDVLAVRGDNHGNDKVRGNDFEDFFEADKGNDKYDGWGGYNTLSYTWASLHGGAQGIRLDAESGKAVGVFGDKDEFRYIHIFQASMMDDKLSGATGPAYEWFYGLGGADTINGRKGRGDIVSYEKDAEFGGLSGIHADLSVLDGKGFATITDGFGQIDKVKSIEAITATNFNDTLIGSDRAETFVGLAGNDTIDGKGGDDWLDFTKNAEYAERGVPTTGVTVDLSTGVVTDGLGGTDSLVFESVGNSSIEFVLGSSKADIIVGDDTDNTFYGNGGADTLIGGDGDDFLNGPGAEFHNESTTLIGGKGRDRLFGGKNDDSLDGGDDDDILSGSDGNDIMIGGAGDDYIYDDYIFESGGSDIMTGGTGADAFEFAAPGEANVITDFSGKGGDGDTIGLTFGFPFGDETVAPWEFISGAGEVPTTEDQVIIYDTNDGRLYYDADGSKVKFQMVLIAELTGAPALTSTDFYVLT